MTQEEQDFITYWSANRERKKSWVRQLYVGLPLALVIVIGVFSNLLSGWYGRAQMVFFREQGSLILILVIAALGIITFLAVFSARHRWDLQEQRYRELIDRASKTNKTT
jgi:membrane protein YdbS with pleckstrin-like domain